MTMPTERQTGAAIAAAALLSLLASCATPTATPRMPGHLLDAQEALFRHQIARVALPGSDYSAICISTQGFEPPADPPPELLARLSDISPPVKPWSSCRWSEVRPVDSATGLPAVQVAHDLRCADASRCSGTGGYAYGNVGAEHFTYALEWRDGAWVVSQGISAVS